jgi:hypothetical protein
MFSDNEYKKTDWENYRALKKGEVIMDTDEVLHDKKGWKKTICVGGLAPDPQFTSHRMYRRLKTEQDKLEEDKVLLEIYMHGFNDELDGISDESNFSDLRLLRAYNLGREHAIMGDDIRSVDYLTNEEILDRIRNQKS